MGQLKPVIFFLVVGIVALFLVFRKGSADEIPIGAQAPDFSINDDAQKPVKLSQFRGRVVILNFWATWCPPCVKEHPELHRLNQQFKDRKFQMMAVSVDTSWDLVRDFYTKHNLNIPTYLDPGHAVANTYKVTKFPETFIIDGNGSLLKHIVGATDWDGATMVAEIEKYVRNEESRATAAR